MKSWKSILSPKGKFIWNLQGRIGRQNNQKFNQLQSNKGKKGKEKQEEGEEDEFVSEEAFFIWKKRYAGKGFVGERGFSQLISHFKELIEQRGWGKFYKHQKSGYAVVVREFYSNLVGRKEKSVYVRGVCVPYGAETINEMYGMEGQKHGSKYKKITDNP